MGVTSADSLETTGGMTPADALGEPKRMSQKTLGEFSYTATCPTCGECFDTPRQVKGHHTSHGRPYYEARIETEYGVPADWLLRTLYTVLGDSTRKIADKLGCGKCAVNELLRRHGIDVRTSSREKPPSFGIKDTDSPYERWSHSIDHETHHVYVHRLFAVAEYGFDAVADMHVHHRNEIPWDTRSDNIELMAQGDHIGYHSRIDPKRG